MTWYLICGMIGGIIGYFVGHIRAMEYCTKQLNKELDKCK